MAGIDYNYAAQAYGFDPEVLRYVHKYENGGRTTFDYNNWDSNAKRGTPSAGPFQFIEPTFKAYARQAREANPAAWRNVPMRWDNPMAQALAASWAMKNGKGSAWTTYDRAVKAAGGVKPNRLAKGLAAAVTSMGAQPQQVDPIFKGTSFENLSTDEGLERAIFKGTPFEQFLEDRTYASPTAPSMQRGGGPNVKTGKGVPARRPGETGQQYLDRVLMARFGLKHDPGNSQTTGGKHMEGSDHYVNKATDFGDARNDPATIQAAVDWVNANREALGAKPVVWQSAGHYDHAHFATYKGNRGTKKRGPW